MKISLSDAFLIIGLVLTGTGLFFWFGLGQALTTTGALMLGLGAAWNVAEAKK